MKAGAYYFLFGCTECNYTEQNPPSIITECPDCGSRIEIVETTAPMGDSK